MAKFLGKTKVRLFGKEIEAEEWMSESGDVRFWTTLGDGVCGMMVVPGSDAIDNVVIDHLERGSTVNEFVAAVWKNAKEIKGGERPLSQIYRPHQDRVSPLTWERWVAICNKWGVDPNDRNWIITDAAEPLIVDESPKRDDASQP